MGPDCLCLETEDSGAGAAYDRSMKVPGSPLLRDGMLAAVLTVATQVELLVAAERVQGSPYLQAVAFAVLTGSVMLRRAAPLAATLVAAAGMALQTLAGPAPVVGGFLAMLVVVASLGFHAPLRAGVVGLAAMGTAAVLYDLIAEQLVLADLVGNLAIVLMAWGSARMVRQSIDRRVAAEVAGDRLARESVLAERTRIARDLHDSVAHALTLMTLQAGAVRERASEPVAVEALGLIEETGREALDDMHRFLGLLGEGVTEDESRSLSDVEGLVDRFRAGGLSVMLHMSGDLAGLPASVSATAYRVLQEGLTNTMKHSSSDTVEATVDVTDTEVRVTVTDIGGRTKPSRDRRGVASSGTGLRGLRERVSLYGGRLIAAPAGDDGWLLDAVIPTGRT